MLAFWAAIALLLLCGCSAPTVTAEARTPSASSPRLVTVEVPMTVEVTREIITERIVPATPVPPTPCAPQTLAEAEEVVVGVLMPLSQSSSLAATNAARTGIVLASSVLNEAQGVQNTPVQLWWADTGNLPAQGRSAAEDAILNHCAVALIGSNNSETAAEIDAVAQKYGVPHIVIDGAANELTAAQSPTLFRLTPNTAMVAAMYADWLTDVGDYNGDGILSAAIITQNSDWPLAVAGLISDALVEHLFSVDSYVVDPSSQDFSSLIARIVVKDTLPDAILVRVNGDAGITLLRQLIENGVGPRQQTLLVVPHLLTTEDAAALNGEENMHWLISPRVGMWMGAADERATPLLDGYTQLFSRWPESAAFLGYDSLLLLADAMRRAVSLAPADLVNAMEQTDIDLAGGHYRFPYTSLNPPAGNVPDWSWHQWLDQPMLFLQYDEQSPPAPRVIWPPQWATVEGPVMRPADAS